MDTENPTTTTHGLLAQPISPPNSDPTADERKLMILLKLGSHYWTPSFTRAQAKELLADYLEDLAKYTPPELESFAGTWRRDVSRTRFPKIGEIVFAIARARADAADRATRTPGRATPAGPDKKPYPDGKSRPICWWMQPKDRWNPSWKEYQVPVGEMICESAAAPLREPNRFEG